MKTSITPFDQFVIQAQELFEAEVTYAGPVLPATTGGALRAAFLRRGATLAWPRLPFHPLLWDTPGGWRRWDYPEVTWRWQAAKATEVTLKLILLVFATPLDAGPRLASMFQARTLVMRRGRDGEWVDATEATVDQSTLGGETRLPLPAIFANWGPSDDA